MILFLFQFQPVHVFSVSSGDWAIQRPFLSVFGLCFSNLPVFMSFLPIYKRILRPYFCADRPFYPDSFNSADHVLQYIDITKILRTTFCIKHSEFQISNSLQCLTPSAVLPLRRRSAAFVCRFPHRAPAGNRPPGTDPGSAGPPADPDPHPVRNMDRHQKCVFPRPMSCS